MAPIKPYFLHHTKVTSAQPLTEVQNKALYYAVNNSKGNSRLHPQIHLLTVEARNQPENSQVHVFFKQDQSRLLPAFTFEDKTSKSWADFSKKMVIASNKKWANLSRRLKLDNLMNGFATANAKSSAAPASKDWGDKGRDYYYKMAAEVMDNKDVKLAVQKHQLEKQFEN